MIEAGLHRFDGQGFDTVALAPGAGDEAVTAIRQGADSLWFGTGTGVGAALIIEKPWVAAGIAVLGGAIGHFSTYYSRRNGKKE